MAPSPMTSGRPLAGISVVECGNRIAVSACGSLLLSLGADVAVVEDPLHPRSAVPPVQLEGKSRLAPGGERIRQADILVVSSDLGRAPAHERPSSQIVCDITAYGRHGPLAGVGHPDAFVQAICGLADTTGEPDSAPTLCGFPQTEGIAALYAAAGVLAALSVRARDGVGQDLDIAMYDCAFSTLSTFLPFHFVGRSVTRAGNRHVLASPWNAYRAADGWLLVCTGSDEQWVRLCEVIGQPALAHDPRLGKASDRVAHRDIVDTAVQTWIAAHSAADAATRLEARGIAAGPVVPVEKLAHEPNIAYRGLFAASGMRSAIRYFAAGPADARTRATAARNTGRWYEDASAGMPFEGLKVLEIGQYTTAPLVARTLGALGAQVLKIEPPSGDATRAWPPQRDGQGYFFALSNSDKQSLCLDLRNASDRERFRELLAQADVLVENMKPGSLDKLGFDQAARTAANPGLVYCAISGFGADSAYPGRPAFDTVVQAMSGIMDSIRVGETPQKTGVSYADVLGGLFALVGTLGALVERRRTGTGDAIDISMQDAAAWICQWQRAASAPPSRFEVVRCRDGYIVTASAHTIPAGLLDAARDDRRTAIERLGAQGIAAAPVLSIGEVAQSDHAMARRLLVDVADSAGREWRVFACPIRLGTTPARTRRAIGPLGEARIDPDGEKR